MFENSQDMVAMIEQIKNCVTFDKLPNQISEQHQIKTKLILFRIPFFFSLPSFPNEQYWFTKLEGLSYKHSQSAHSIGPHDVIEPRGRGGGCHLKKKDVHDNIHGRPEIQYDTKYTIIIMYL